METDRSESSHHSDQSGHEKQPKQQQQQQPKQQPGDRKTSQTSNSSDESARREQQQKQKKSANKKNKSKEKDMQERLLRELHEWERHRQSEELNEINRQKEREEEDKRRKSESERQQKEEEIEKLEKEIKNAIEKENASKLRRALEHIEEKNHVETFGDVYYDGLFLLRSIERVEGIDKVKSKFTQSCVSEIKSFQKPAEVVQHVVRATLMVLGHDQGSLKEWPACQKEIVVQGNDALHKRVAHFDVNNVNPATASQVLSVLDEFDPSDAYKVCQAAGTFYEWAAGVCEKRILGDNQATKKRKAALSKKRDEIKKEDEKRKKEEQKQSQK